MSERSQSSVTGRGDGATAAYYDIHMRHREPAPLIILVTRTTNRDCVTRLSIHAGSTDRRGKCASNDTPRLD